MRRISSVPGRLRRCIVVLWMVCALCLPETSGAATCASGACVTMGPRLASVSSTQGALLNVVMGNLLGGSSLGLSVLDWNSIAAGSIDLLPFLNALNAQGVGASPSAALTANATLLQMVNAAIAAAQTGGNAALVSALSNLKLAIPGTPVTFPVGQLLTLNAFSATALTNVQLNTLNLVSGLIQLFNYKNVLTTPTPLSLSTGDLSALGLGGTLTAVTVQAQVVEPPTYVCGPTGSVMYSAAIRLKLGLTLVNLAIPGVTANIGNLDVYVDVARATGTITAINAVANALTVQATPGIAGIYLGAINNSIFFTRTPINYATDVTFGTVGSIAVNVLGVGLINASLQLRSQGQASSGAATLSFTGPYPQTRTAGTSTTAIATLISTLSNNLQVTTSSALINLVNGLLGTLLSAVVNLLFGPSSLISSILGGLVDPLLELLGIGLGEVDVTASAVALSCTVSGTVYNDANHNGIRDGGETGTGQTLYTKLISGGSYLQLVAVTPASGAYTLTGVGIGSYSLIVDNNNTSTDLVPTAPDGWVPIQPAPMQRNFSIGTNGVDSLDFGLYNGSQLNGIVFSDIGGGAGVANNGNKDGTESGIVGVSIKATNGTGATIYDTATSDGSGTYVLWIPASAGTTAIRVTEANAAGYVSTGASVGTTSGSYDRIADTVTFTNTIGTIYTGVNFGDVPPNSLDTDGQQTVLPGAAVFYPHAFVAGTAGQLTLSVSANISNPANPPWTSTLYVDSNCNGVLDAGDAVVSGSIAVVAGQKVCMVLKVFVPVNAALNTENQQTVSAAFSYTNASPSLSATATRSDATIVANTTEAGLKLTKSVDKATASLGQTLLYTITYNNTSKDNLSNLKIRDMTPAYTVFVSAACGPLPAGLTGCTVVSPPAIGAGGNLAWDFTGVLQPNASGSVTYVVTVQ